MPEYLAPGVYVEEVSYRAKSIEGVSTTTTAFVGPTRYGPVDLVPDVITSVVEYERIYGDGQPLVFGADTIDNYMWHAIRMFFENGGKRLYVARVFAGNESIETLPSPLPSPLSTPAFEDGVAISKASGTLLAWARFPGSGGNSRVQITLSAGPNIFDGTEKTLRGAVPYDLMMVNGDPTGPPPEFWWAESYFDGTAFKWRLRRNATTTLDLSGGTVTRAQIVSATVTVFPPGPQSTPFVYPDLALDPNHRRGGADDSIAAQFAEEQPSVGRARSIPIVMNLDAHPTGIALANYLISLKGASLGDALKNPISSAQDRSFEFELSGGDDGKLPEIDAYRGKGALDPTSKEKSGLAALEDIDEISIIAAPGVTKNYQSREAQELAILNAVVNHATRMRYRIAVLDSGDDQSVGDVRGLRGKLDSTYAALYYPWITQFDPITQKEIHLPPSGAVCGIYARNDINRGVYKAPANEVVEGAIGLEFILNKAQQDILNPLGVNCFRFFEGRGFRLWGARTISSDPEWKYVNLRRYFAYLEHSLDRGTQWAVFEPNGDRLWANIRTAITDFLFNEWQNGALLGDKPEKAFFVKCDRSTMTQNDLDNGRLVCLVGVAALRPAEYVIIRIGQWTADRKV
ncbi:MAG: phage tail sheath family protein [Thermoanaerobaculia bacterium]